VNSQYFLHIWREEKRREEKRNEVSWEQLLVLYSLPTLMFGPKGSVAGTGKVSHLKLSMYSLKM
jgi:hypothetical protein